MSGEKYLEQLEKEGSDERVEQFLDAHYCFINDSTKLSQQLSTDFSAIDGLGRTVSVHQSQVTEALRLHVGDLYIPFGRAKVTDKGTLVSFAIVY